MRLKSTLHGASSTVVVLVLAIAGPLPATASDTEGAAEPAPSGTTGVAEVDDSAAAGEPTDVSGPDLIEVTTPEKSTPIPLPLENFYLPITLGPVFNLAQPVPQTPAPVTRFGGGAVGAYVEAQVGDLGLKIGKVGGVYMPSGRSVATSEVSRIEAPIWPVAGLVWAKAIESRSSASLAPLRAESVSKIGRLELRPAANLSALLPVSPILGPVITADSIESSAVVSQGPDGEYVTTAQVRSGSLTINGKVVSIPDAAPNTTYDVVGLGKVVLNEQQLTRLPGEKYAAKVHALHITLSTARAGLPVGAHIYLGTAEAVIHP